MDERDLKFLTKLRSALEDDSITREDFTKAFKAALAVIAKKEEKLTEKLDQKEQEQAAELQSLKEEIRAALKEVKQSSETTFASIRTRALESMEAIFARMRITERVNEALDDFSAKASDLESRIALVPDAAAIAKLVTIPESEKETGISLRDKLESLEGDERTDKTAIKGIEEIEEKIKAIEIRPTGGAGRSLLQLYVDGAKKGAVQYINLVAGSGVALTYSSAYGRNDITISATGSGSFSILTATGTIDDSNKDFTFVSKPSFIVVNGASRIENTGWTWNAGTLTATLSNPVGTGGDLYGVG